MSILRGWRFMTELQISPVESGLDKVADSYRDVLAERDHSTIWVYSSKKKNDLSRSFFGVNQRDGRYWVRCQGKGGTRPEYPGPAIGDIAEEWVVREATQFIETTVHGFGLKSEAAGS
jgi:hypothetical protein